MNPTRPSRWIKTLSQPGNLRAVAVDATELVRELCATQNLVGQSQVGLAEAVLGALLVAARQKGDESINLNARGSGRFRQAVIDAGPDGRVRGFLTEDANAAVAGWGAGTLSVLYTRHGSGKAPYTGMVPIAGERLDDAINVYFRDSEQVDSRVGFDIALKGPTLERAHGAIVQTLGGAGAIEIDALGTLSIADLRGLAAEAGDARAFVRATSGRLRGRAFEVVEERALATFCTCSEERIERALTLTGEADSLEALGEDPFLTVTCDFCRRGYRLSADRVRALFSRDPGRLQ